MSDVADNLVQRFLVIDAETPPDPCVECSGDGVLFRGSGKETQFYICTRRNEPGHPSRGEILKKIQERMGSAVPSGRHA